MTRLHRLLIWATALAAVAAAFTLYLRPEFMVTLADQIWACF
jgi:hypothetical protein